MQILDALIDAVDNKSRSRIFCLFAKICDNGPLALRRTKEAMVRGRNMALEDGLSLELAFFEEMLQSEDYKEGLQALAEERKPKYKGLWASPLSGRGLEE